MKKLMLISFITTTLILRAMDEEKPYLPAIPMVNPETGEGYFVGMPDDIKGQIIQVIFSAPTLKEAGKAIQALATTNKRFHEMINDDKVTKNLVHVLVAKFGGYHEDIAKALGTKGAEQYVKINDLALHFNQFNNIEEAQKYALSPRIDFHYLTHSGSNILESNHDQNAIMYFIKQGFNINSVYPGKDRRTVAGMLLTQRSDLSPDDILFILHHISPELINQRTDSLGNTLLHRLVEKRKQFKNALDKWYEAIEFLIISNIQVSQKNDAGATALDQAKRWAGDNPDPWWQKVITLLEQTEKDHAAQKQ